ARTLVDATGVRGFEPYVQRNEATLLREQGADAALVEATLERSIALARKQKVRLSELRATVELARLWQSQGRHAEARERLQAIYAWFTEGFHTPDLRAARILLDDLGSAIGASGSLMDKQATVARRPDDKAPPR
ncbi:MAG: hypothetical protein ACREJ0_16105, partial [Geminicoccaceae bacterium]